MRVFTVFMSHYQREAMNVLSFLKLTKRHVFNLNSIFPKIYGAFSLFIFCSLILGFTKCQIKEDQNNEKYFHPNETKTPLIFKQIDLVQDSTTSYFFKASRGS